MLFVTASFLFHLVISANAIGNNQASNESKSKQKVIIIADPGVDDAAAILMAVAHPDIDVLAVLSNFGILLSPCTNMLITISDKSPNIYLSSSVPCITTLTN